MTKLLSKINSPKDLKKIPVGDLTALAAEIREKIIDVVSKTGGHLASSLGAVELAIALHYCFDMPKDKIVWDVGHQAYPHKILTGRAKNFDTLRQLGGISGFPSRLESEYDIFTCGHSSTSISLALGLACARDLKNESGKMIAVIGDAALAGGMALEACNHAGHLKKDLIVTLEEGVATGGFGSAILEFFEREKIKDVRVERIGLPDQFITHGRREELLKEYHLTADEIAETIKREMFKHR